MKFSFVSLVTKLTLATSVAGALVGCDEPTYPAPSPIETASAAQALYQIVNAAPGGNDAQLLSIDNVAPTSAFAPIPYLETATYANLPAGQRLLLFSVTGNLNSQRVAVRPTFSTNSNTTVFLTDSPTRAAAGTDPGGVRTVVLADNLTAPTVATRAKVRFVNLSSSGTYGIFNTTTVPAGVSLFSAIPTRRFRDITFTTPAVPPSTTATITNFANFTEVPEGLYTLDARSAATTALTGTRLPVTLAAGKIYTLYVRGIAGNTTTPLGISVVTHN